MSKVAGIFIYKVMQIQHAADIFISKVTIKEFQHTTHCRYFFIYKIAPEDLQQTTHCRYFHFKSCTRRLPTFNALQILSFIKLHKKTYNIKNTADIFISKVVLGDF